MVTCDICGKEFKNAQGLRGHMTFVHGKTGSSKILSAPAATGQRLSKLEQLLGITRSNTQQAIEQPVSRLRARLGLSENTTESITEQLAELTKQLTEFTEQTTKKLDELDERVELAQISKGLYNEDRRELDEALEVTNKVKDGHNDLVRVVNNNAEQVKSLVNIVKNRLDEVQLRVDLLFQALDEHRHTEIVGGAVLGSSEANKLIDTEVAIATKRRGKLPETVEPAIVKGKHRGYRYLEHLGISVRNEG